MKREAITQLRRKLQSDTPAFGLRITLGAAAVADIAAALGLDWICVDVPGGPLDWRDVREHVSATARSQTVALVRLADSSPETIAYAQTLGADGVLIPCPTQAAGLQSVLMRFREREAEVNSHFIIAPVIPDSCSAQDLSPFVAIEDVDFFMIDPGIIGAKERDDRAHLILSLRNAGKQAGVFAMDQEEVQRSLGNQFRVIGVGSDVAIVQSEIRTMLELMNVRRVST